MGAVLNNELIRLMLSGNLWLATPTICTGQPAWPTSRRQEGKGKLPAWSVLIILRMRCNFDQIQIGVESGHAIGSSLPLVRTLYRMGARYMTLTHGCNTPWADAAQVEVGDFPPRVGGLSEFGEKVRPMRSQFD